MLDHLQEWRLGFDLVLAATCLLYVAGVLWFRRGLAPPSTEEAADDLPPASEDSLPASEDSPTASEDSPFVSILVAARDEERHIEACIDGLQSQSYPPGRYEIIVVDDGSLDRTAALVSARERSTGAQTGCAVRLVRSASSQESEGRGRRPGSKKAALQLGVDEAQGEIILSTDADCRVPPAWVASMVDEFGPEVGMVIGFSQIGSGKLSELRLGWEAVDFFNLMLAAMGSARRGHALAASGQSLGFRKQAFVGVGGYGRVSHRVSGDDVLLLQLIRRSGNWQIRFCRHAEAIVIHPASRSWRALLSQRARWASNATCQLWLDPPFFGYLSVTFGFGLLQVCSPLLVLGGALSLPVVLAVIVCKIAAEWSLLKRGSRLFPRDGLVRYYPFWTAVHPVYLTCVGIIGCCGRFSWKGDAFWWGGTKRRARQAADAAGSLG